MSIFQFRSNFPLEKFTENYEETILPSLAFRINPGHMKSLRNRNVNVDNIFSLNRLGIDEAFEEGKSLTLGLNYRKNKKIDYSEVPDEVKDKIRNKELDEIERYFEIKLAGVLRDVEENKISSATTLNRKASNLFGSITNKLNDNLELDYNFSIDNDLSTFENNDITLKFSVNNLISTFGFSEANGEMGTKCNWKRNTIKNK